MNGAVEWIKLWTKIFKDDKIRLIRNMPEGDSLFVIWLQLLSLAGEQNQRGEILGIHENSPYTEEMLAILFERKQPLLRLALKTFSEFRMIEIHPDKRIVICNWSKYQSVEGLEKIRLQNAERLRRHREKKALCNGARSVSRNVSGHYHDTAKSRCVTHPEKEIQKKNIEDPLQSPKGGWPAGENLDSWSHSPGPELTKATDQGNDPIQHAEAKTLLAEFCQEVFPREAKKLRLNIWPDNLQHWLSEALPLAREDWRLIDWAYRTPMDHPLRAVTRLRQSFSTLLENLATEPQKIASARKQIGLNGLHSPEAKRAQEPEPAGWHDAAFELYGEETPMPRSFWDFPDSSQQEIRQAIEKRSSQSPS